MNGFLRDLIINLVSSLLTTILITIIPRFIQTGKTPNPDFFWGVVINYRFLLYWISILSFFIFIRWFIRNRIEKLQTPYPMAIGFKSSYDAEAIGQSYGMKWRVYLDVKRINRHTREVLDANVGNVDGPFCKNDFRKMAKTRTFLGRYKYKCPKCGDKVILLKDTWTLKCEVEDEIEAEYRTKLDESN